MCQPSIFIPEGHARSTEKAEWRLRRGGTYKEQRKICFAPKNVEAIERGRPSGADILANDKNGNSLFKKSKT